jgi:hypothetical protein
MTSALPKSHRHFASFFEIIRKNQETLCLPWEGEAFRAVLPRWASVPYVLTGVGALNSGGRWNVPGLMPAVYFSIDAQTLGGSRSGGLARSVGIRIFEATDPYRGWIQTGTCFGPDVTKNTGHLESRQE